MTYDSITEDGRLWAVKYDDCPDNALYMLFEQWNDVAWLYQFFKENMAETAIINFVFFIIDFTFWVLLDV